MDPRIKECFVVLDKIDVTPYRYNLDNHVLARNVSNSGENIINCEKEATANNRNTSDDHLLERNNYSVGANEIDSEEEATAEFLLLASSYLLIQDEINESKTVARKRKARQVWVREWTKKRQTDGVYVKLLRELRDGDPGEQRLFREFIRMSNVDFEYILELVKPLIEKTDTKFRDSISAGERLALTLHFLATGNSYASLQYLFRIPQPTISIIIPEVLDAIWTVLKDEYVRVGCKFSSHSTFLSSIVILSKF